MGTGDALQRHWQCVPAMPPPTPPWHPPVATLAEIGNRPLGSNRVHAIGPLGKNRNRCAIYTPTAETAGKVSDYEANVAIKHLQRRSELLQACRLVTT